MLQKNGRRHRTNRPILPRGSSIAIISCLKICRKFEEKAHVTGGPNVRICLNGPADFGGHPADFKPMTFSSPSAAATISHSLERCGKPSREEYDPLSRLRHCGPPSPDGDRKTDALERVF
jgi:hypothetical protein